MTITRLKTFLGAATIAASFVGGAAAANADSLEAIMQVGKERTAEARASQTKIDRLADETRDLLEKLRQLSSSKDDNIAELNKNITEIIIAQNFQDLASQSLTKALKIIKQVENSLISLTQYANLLTKLSQFSGKSATEVNVEESAQLKDNIDKFNDLNNQEHLDQDEVDNLLSSLGF